MTDLEAAFVILVIGIPVIVFMGVGMLGLAKMLEWLRDRSHC